MYIYKDIRVFVYLSLQLMKEKLGYNADERDKLAPIILIILFL